MRSVQIKTKGEGEQAFIVTGKGRISEQKLDNYTKIPKPSLFLSSSSTIKQTLFLHSVWQKPQTFTSHNYFRLIKEQFSVHKYLDWTIYSRVNEIFYFLIQLSLFASSRHKKSLQEITLSSCCIHHQWLGDLFARA